MKTLLYRSRQTVVGLLKLLLYILLAAILFGLLSIHNPWILTLSRTAAVTGLMFVLSCFFLAHIYGKFDIGERKSKPIIFSLTLSMFFADLITFVMLVIMNTNQTTAYGIYSFIGPDIGLVVLAFAIQTALIIVYTYAAHAFYFSFVPPERCLVITNNDESLAHLMGGIRRFQKQFHIVGIVPHSTPDLEDQILQVDSVFLHDLDQKQSMNLISFCYNNRINIYRTMDIPDIVTMNSSLMILDDVSLVNSKVKEITMGQRIAKRLMDISIALIGTILSAPVLLVAALAIKLEDGGSPLFRQNRVTIRGRIFTIYKLRTMVMNADKSMVTAEDERITKVGAVLRKYRIDELPQFWNVLRGDMSIVGPRPEMVEYVYLYSEALPEFLYRYRMKAGLTGYAQINGRYNTDSRNKLMMDLTYIQTFNLWNDVKIIFQTILVLFKASDSTEAFASDEEEKRRARAKKAEEG